MDAYTSLGSEQSVIFHILRIIGSSGSGSWVGGWFGPPVDFRVLSEDSSFLLGTTRCGLMGKGAGNNPLPPKMPSYLFLMR